MNIKQRIENIKQYFKEMQITTVGDQQVIYVVVNFPRNWIIDENIESKFGIKVAQGTNVTEYYFCTDIDSGEDVLFDAIDYNIEKMKEAIERAQLLSLKTKELKSIFENENISIEKLRTLKFAYDDDVNSLQNEFSEILITKAQEEKESFVEQNEENTEMEVEENKTSKRGNK
jgi:hypothetical protein